MPTSIDHSLTPKKLLPKIYRLFELSAQKILSIERTWKPEDGTPVFTVRGKYTSRGWTEWTQGFQYGSALLQFDATEDEQFLEIGRRNTIDRMSAHVSHTGVHDHGFNNISTYGNLWRLMREGKIPRNENENDFYELALKVSGAIQAARWTPLNNGQGFIHSFNGPHSLFIDTVRSLRSLAIAHQLGHVLMGEQDERISLLKRLIQHAVATASFSVFFGEQRDAYDVRGRTTHECIFNVVSRSFRCPNSQQGYSPFSTWTRGLAWAICGFAEQLEFLWRVPEASFPLWEADGQVVPAFGGKESVLELMLESATATAEFYLETSCADGVPMWDTDAPNLHRMPRNYLSQVSNPFNQHEPVDSSAAAIAAQGFIRLGNYLSAIGKKRSGARYRQAGLTIAKTIFDEPYLSANAKHQGLILHSVYHRPNGWDYVAAGQKVPNGESSMWGDYHARELALLILREAEGESYLTFFAY